MNRRALAIAGGLLAAVVLVVAILWGPRRASDGLAETSRPEMAANARDTGAASAAPASPSKRLQVEAVPATLETAEKTLQVTGTVEARLGQDVTPELGGRVTKVFVDEGDFVRKGATLVQLDDDIYRAQLREAEGALKAAQARLRQAEHGTTLTDAETEARIAQVRAQVDAAQSELGKARTAAMLQDETGESQIEQARAGLEGAEAQLKEIKRGAREQELRRAEATVDQARAVVDKMEKGVEQRRRLVQAGAISLEEFITYLTEYRVRKSQYDSAKQALDLLEEGATAEQIAAAEAQVRAARELLKQAVSRRAQTDIRRRETEAAEARVTQVKETLAIALANARQVQVREEDVQAAQGAVQQAQAQIDLIRLRIDRTAIRAPLTGVVSERNVEPGDLVGPTSMAALPGIGAASLARTPGASTRSGLIRIVDISSVDIQAKVSEKSISEVTLGQSANVRVDAIPGRTFTGRVSEVDVESLPGQRSFYVTVRVLNPASLLRPGMFARVSLILRRVQDAVMVPTDAIVRRDGRTVLYVVGEDGAAHERAVQTGIEKGPKTQIVGDVRPGELVVVAGQDLLRDRVAIRVNRQ